MRSVLGLGAITASRYCSKSTDTQDCSACQVGRSKGAADGSPFRLFHPPPDRQGSYDRQTQPGQSTKSQRKPQGQVYRIRNQQVIVPDGYLAVGHIIGVYGLRGELKVELYTDFPERFALAPGSSWAPHWMT